ncbi:MAG: sigma-70 family RNA polymerase sigma factor [Planctomycetes bacterium]|nr:sigma-70 family RNA polymerase sigma factor [Planctomycetota bacterium]
MRPPPSEPVPATEVPLARRVARGDEAAFVQFYEAWFGPVCKLARVLSRRDEDFALDVVQDVMMTVARKLPMLRDDAAVRAWMARTVANAVTDRLRAEQRRRRREQSAGQARAAHEVPEPWLGIAAAERQAWLAGVLAALPAVDRELLAARFGGAATVAATAAAFGLGADAAHGRLRRALRRVRHAAAEWWHG